MNLRRSIINQFSVQCRRTYSGNDTLSTCEHRDRLAAVLAGDRLEISLHVKARDNLPRVRPTKHWPSSPRSVGEDTRLNIS